MRRDVVAAYAMTVAEVRALLPTAPPGGADSYPDGWESLDGDVAAAKCYIDADIAKVPPPVPEQAPARSFDRAVPFAAEGVDAPFHAAGNQDTLTPEPPAEDQPPIPTAGTHPVSLALFHCGIRPATVDGRLSEADRSELLLDGTNAPPSWAGTGTAVIDGDRMTYTDEGGKAVPFVPDDGVPPPACL